jgi:catechol 2,3-dioxygenase-like lactoylglutathione lyase family enzyme
MHHVHLFAEDLGKSLEFYTSFFGGEIVLDMEVAGARNVFMKIGTGRIHFYDQPPKVPGPGSIHHFGIQTDNVASDYDTLKAGGVSFKKGVTDLGYMKYVMVPAPDDVLIELFEIDRSVIPSEYQEYFPL